jgi:hypothetical protein
MPFFPFSFFLPIKSFTCLPLTLTLRPPSRISLFFLGIALYIKTCLELHRIRTTHVSIVLASFLSLSCHYSSFSPSPPASPCASFWAFACPRGGGRCFVLSCSCPVLSRSELIDRPFPPWSHCLLSILSFLSLFLSFSFVSRVSYSSTSKCRASLLHTCTTTKF